MKTSETTGPGRSRPKRATIALAGALLAGFALAGCDRCGDPVKFNTPTLPKSCYGVPTEK